MIDQDEFMKMVTDAGADVLNQDENDPSAGYIDISIEQMRELACALLERAAVECEEEPFANHPHIIRALKPTQEV